MKSLPTPIAVLLLIIGIFLVSLFLATSNKDEPDEEETPTSENSSFTSSDVEEDYIDLYATMLAFNPNDGFVGLGSPAEALSEGWLAFRSDESFFSSYLSNLETRFESSIAWAKATGFSIDREIPGAFTWNVIEPVEGDGYHWDISDRVVESANSAGMSVSALIHPFAAWDQDSIPEGCQGVDFAYYDYLADTPTNWEAYRDFLSATVERYDGDGEDDMPGLLYPIKHWEIGNEYDGTCGGDLNEAENYFELIKVSSDVIHETDSEANVLNMGALELSSNVTDIKGFWEDFFALGGGEYIDIFNFHYNKEKFRMAETSSEFEEHLTFFSETMAANDAVKPMWITEFGTYSGTPVVDSAPPGGNAGGQPNSPTQTEEEQAAWYFRYSILAFSQGVEKIFVDLHGRDNNTIGGSALYNDEGEQRAFLDTLKGLGQYLDGFESVEKLIDGQYLFEVDGEKVYALWDGDLPEAIEGEVTMMDFLGEISVVDASNLSFDEESPILVLGD